MVRNKLKNTINWLHLRQKSQHVTYSFGQERQTQSQGQQVTEGTLRVLQSPCPKEFSIW